MGLVEVALCGGAAAVERTAFINSFLTVQTFGLVDRGVAATEGGVTGVEGEESEPLRVVEVVGAVKSEEAAE